MRRKLLNLATALSLLLCAAACGLWARSYWVSDTLVHTRPNGAPASVTFWSTSGYLALVRWEPPVNSAFRVEQRGWVYGSGSARANGPWRFIDSPNSSQFLGVVYFDFTWTRQNSPFNGVRERAWLVPQWMPAAALAALPVVRSVSWWRRRR